MSQRILNKMRVRAATLLISAVLFTYSAATVPIQHTLFDVGGLVATALVGVSAGVAENPVNTRLAELEEYAAELERREAVISQGTASSPLTLTEKLGVVSFVLSLVLLVLVLANFLFDWRRQRSSAYSVNLRGR